MSTNKKLVLQTKDSFLEKKKNLFLLALYEKKYSTAETIYSKIIFYAKKQIDLSENDEKILRQVQLIFKKLYPLSSFKNKAQIYKYNKLLAKVLLKFIKKESNENKMGRLSFECWKKKLGLNKKQKALVYKTAMNFQLTKGCSNYCRRCNEWALPKARKHFSYDAVVKILNNMCYYNNHDISLYSASDPLDWSDKKKNIYDILKSFKDIKCIRCDILTKVPRGKEKLCKKLLNRKMNFSISLISKNKKRIKQIEETTSTIINKQHDLDELLIPARLDEDFVSIKPSITDGYGTEITLDGAFIIVPSFTSALHPFGHKKIDINKNTKFFLAKKTGRKALLTDYFKPLNVYNLRQKKHYLNSLMDVQIESIILDNGKDELTPPGMRSIKEYFAMFEEKARKQRKKNTLVVLKKFKKHFLHKISFKRLSEKNRKIYLKKIKAHLDMCKKKYCLKAKLFTASFFLKEIDEYQRRNFVKTKIMKFLLRKEIEKSFKDFSKVLPEPEKFFMDDSVDSFYVFRFCIFCLIAKSGIGKHKSHEIQFFIKKFSAVYDPDADLFTSFCDIPRT